MADGGPAFPSLSIDFKHYFEHRQWDLTKSLDPKSGLQSLNLFGVYRKLRPWQTVFHFQTPQRLTTKVPDHETRWSLREPPRRHLGQIEYATS